MLESNLYYFHLLSTRSNQATTRVLEIFYFQAYHLCLRLKLSIEATFKLRQNIILQHFSSCIFQVGVNRSFTLRTILTCTFIVLAMNAV